MRLLLRALAPVLLPVGVLLHAQATPAATTAAAPRPRLEASWVTTAPVIDGRLDEAIWRTAAPAGGFVQRSPVGGAAPSQRTEVRVAYDQHAIYVGVRNFDTAPDSIAQQLGRRDASDIFSDWFSVGFDSYGDRRTAFIFSVNPRGVLRDAYLSNDEEEDELWDAVWNVAARTDSAGWTAEFRIPLSQLRYDVRGDVGATRPWGINFLREIARHGEEDYWAPTPADAPGIVSRFGDLTGLDSLRPASRVEVIPYVRTQLELQPPSARNRFVPARKGAIAAGGDVRLKLPQSLTLTASVNPDFGQVEADPAVVNLSAFEIFFPERRPFFLENQDGFAFGSTRTFNDNDAPRFFYTRRIGRPPQRVPGGEDVDAVGVANQTPILGALKLSGTTPSGWQVGALNAVTARATADVADTLGRVRQEAAEPLTNYHVSRVRKLLRGGNAGIGGFISDVHRDLGRDTALTTRLPGAATIVGLDWESAWQRRTWTVSGVLARSDVRGDADAITRLQRANYRSLQRPDASHLGYDPTRTSLTGHYGAVTLAKSAGDRVLASVTYEETSPGFEVNDIGYQFRSDFRTVSTYTTYRNPLQSSVARDYEFGVYTTVSDNFGGERIEERVSWSADATLLNFWSVNTFGSYSPETQNDRLLRGGPLALRPALLVTQVSVESDPRKAVIMGGELTREADASGRRRYGADLAFDWRPAPQARVRVAPTYAHEHITAQYVQAEPDLLAASTAAARYVFANVHQREVRLDTRLDWTFSPWLSLQLFLQPFASSGKFTRFKEFTTPRRFDFAEYGVDRGTVTPLGGGALRVDPDGSGPAVPFTIANQDFTVRALRGNAVLRWEYRPGSALFLVWSQQREQAFDDVRSNVVSEASRSFADPGRQVFLVKFSRWIGR
ncbi:MAG: carbohydrate binding family 9 domain-containing protein [Gemmatimonadaceae bacterium]|nr:carbohydrate binding family 9 domain-containing protein [Gemmatimonadaceae bacterium]